MFYELVQFEIGNIIFLKKGKQFQYYQSRDIWQDFSDYYSKEFLGVQAVVKYRLSFENAYYTIIMYIYIEPIPAFTKMGSRYNQVFLIY